MPNIDKAKWDAFQKGFRKHTGADQEPEPETQDTEEQDETTLSKLDPRKWMGYK